MWNKLLLFPVCLLTTLGVMADYPPMDIQTRDGQTFKNAVVEGVNPGGIDIGYVNADGYYVLKGLSFKNLPEDLQERFGYDPQEEQEFEKKIQAYSGKNMESVTEDAKSRLERIIREIKAKFSGEDITIQPEDLRFAIYSGRSSVKVRTVAPTRSGCVVKITERISGAELKKDIIQIDGGNLPDDGEWSGFIYPTGLKARYKGEEIPVYADSLDRAAELVDRYLEIYGTYAAATPEDNGLTDTAPEQALAENDATTMPTIDDFVDVEQAQKNAASTDSDGDTLGKVPYYGNNDPYYYSGFGGVYTYYIGPSYRPVCWWNHHHRPPHRPPRPGWGRPPRPPYPGWTPPSRPNRPNWNRPGRPHVSGKPQIVIPQPRPTPPASSNATTVTSSTKPATTTSQKQPTKGIHAAKPVKPANSTFWFKPLLPSTTQPTPTQPAAIQKKPVQSTTVQKKSTQINRSAKPGQSSSGTKNWTPQRSAPVLQRSGNFSRLRR